MRTKMRGSGTAISAAVDGDRQGSGEQNAGAAQLKLLRSHYESSYNNLYLQALKIVGSPEVADDVVQEAFLNTATAIAKGAKIKNLRGWLSRCVRNGSLGYKRNWMSSCETLQEEFSLIDLGSSTEFNYARKRYNRQVCEALGRLVPALRKVFVMAELQGIKHSEIAEEMNCTENSVRQSLIRARRHIRETVDPKLTPAIPPALQSLNTDDSVPGRGRIPALYDYLAGKLSRIHGEMSTFVQRSAEAISQPATALVAGTVVVIALGAGGVWGGGAKNGSSLAQQFKSSNPTTKNAEIAHGGTTKVVPTKMGGEHRVPGTPTDGKPQNSQGYNPTGGPTGGWRKTPSGELKTASDRARPDAGPLSSESSDNFDPCAPTGQLSRTCQPDSLGSIPPPISSNDSSSKPGELLPPNNEALPGGPENDPNSRQGGLDEPGPVNDGPGSPVVP